MQNNILIIDDDIELCQLLKRCLEKEGIAADFSNTGMDGLKQAAQRSYYLIVLDVMLPEMNGFDVLTNLRKTSTVPVLMLTAKDSEIDKVSGLRLGADDYLTKPFSINEFVARVESLIRRYTTLNNSNKHTDKLLCLKGIIIDTKNRTVTVNGNIVDLTGKEFDLLYFLASNRGQVFTKKQIYSHVWKDEYAFDDGNVMAYMSKLRKKIESDVDKPIYIQTVWGVGYRFSQEV
ncbi:MAG: response regulator transcription factor [Spirochaetes bacterium]|nr:response regulator transcription factor [Spirochaetota bacterium]